LIVFGKESKRISVVQFKTWRVSCRSQDCFPRPEKRRKFQIEGDFLRLASDVGVIQIISPDGSYSLELKKRRKKSRDWGGGFAFHVSFSKRSVQMFARNIG
jgi:hypothetical protein